MLRHANYDRAHHASLIRQTQTQIEDTLANNEGTPMTPKFLA
jgi:hypothetical protein